MEQTEEYNLNDATPAEKIKGDMDVLKNVVSADGLDATQKKQIEEQIANISNSIMGGLGKDISPEKLKENQELLTSLSSKGFEKATVALSLLDAAFKEVTGVDLNSVLQMAGDFSKMSGAIQKDNPERPKGHLKETLSRLSNDGKGPMPEKINGVGRPAIFEKSEAMHKPVENKSALADVLRRQAGR